MDSTALSRWAFGLVILVLVAAIVAVPLALGRALGLDARTPANAAYETLHDSYGLAPVNEDGDAMKPDDGPQSASEFGLTSGTTTEDVPFRHGRTLVHCTIHVPDDPADTTADCAS